ncbi:MAG: DUF937 domain-containing protein [Flavobacteriaceae bacterium]|nr:DUF937 domain-containing protein [Flavobacteriaceae bacterium]
MSGIMNLLGGDLGKSLVEGLSSQTGQSKSNTSNLLNMAMPVLLQAMQRNTSSPKGAAGLMGALSNKHDGSILDNLGAVFSGSNSNAVQEDGGKILGHVFGNRQQNIQNALSKQSGVDASSVSKILKIAAPVVMGLLGKQQRQASVRDASGLTNMLGGLIGGNFHNNKQNFFESILDADNDGSIVDDVAGAVLGKSNNDIGGLLGKLFNKK